MVCCKSCSSLKVPGSWIEFNDLDSSVSHFIEQSIEWNQDVTKTKSKLELRQLDPHKFRANINCEGDYQGIILVSELKTEVQIKFQVCQTCSRQAGGYYEAILQIRTKSKEVLDTAVDMVYKELDSSSADFFTTEAGPVRGGYDLQLSSTEKARSVSRDLMVKLGGHVTETNTLVGRKDGRDLLRHTFGVRLPSVKVNDYLFMDDRVWKVSRIDRRRANLILILSPYKQKTVEVDSLRNSPILDSPIDVQIVSHRDSEYLLLDPFTLQTVEAKSPKDWKGDTIKALRYGNDTFFIWN
tara:strand:- start:1613 stop:2503 length:891 start_codon:yes stop_codon:yes gene_type:complete